MSTPIRIALFVVGLAVAFAAALGAGRAVGPIREASPPPMADHGDSMGESATEGQDEAEGGHGGSHEAAAAELPGGLMVSQDGYTLDLTEDRVPAGPRTLTFTITDPEGHLLTDFEREHEKLLHLIAVRRDFAGYQHVHPELTPAGVWTTDLNLSPGTWRLFADFAPFGSEGLTLGTDLLVTGPAAPAPAEAERRTSNVGDYSVELVGDLEAGSAAELDVRVSKDGKPVTDLQPYLGAYGHLVALREGDLAYLHVHPEEGDAGPEVPFIAEVPSEGGYRLFFDFKHDGVVRTASFVVTAGGDHGH
jgi:hypothetical protein